MKARDVIGRKIIGVEQAPIVSNCGRTVFTVDALMFDDGSKLCLSAFELESADGYGIAGTVFKKGELKPW